MGAIRRSAVLAHRANSPCGSKGRSAQLTPPIRCAARCSGDSASNHGRICSAASGSTKSGPSFRSSSQVRAVAFPRVEARRSCISKTSISRSIMALVKASWSLRACATQMTSSKSSSWQLAGVSRRCARPGRHTSTFRRRPTSENSPPVMSVSANQCDDVSWTARYRLSRPMPSIAAAIPARASSATRITTSRVVKARFPSCRLARKYKAAPGA